MPAADAPHHLSAVLGNALPDLKLSRALPTPREQAVLLSAVVGSRAYGLATAGSDTDRRGVFIAGSAIQFSLDGPPPQVVHDDDQLCYWELGRFVRLCLAANPTALETIYSPVVEFAHPAAADMFAAFRRDGTFLSRRLHGSLGGYAAAQLKKLRRSFDAGRPVKWSHAMHLLRLLQLGVRLLETGRFDLAVAPDERKDLLAIKRGEVPWPEIDRRHADLSARFDAALARSPLPPEPDAAAAEAAMTALYVAVARQR